MAMSLPSVFSVIVHGRLKCRLLRIYTRSRLHAKHARRVCRSSKVSSVLHAWNFSWQFELRIYVTNESKYSTFGIKCICITEKLVAKVPGCFWQVSDCLSRKNICDPAEYFLPEPKILQVENSWKYTTTVPIMPHFVWNMRFFENERCFIPQMILEEPEIVLTSLRLFVEKKYLRFCRTPLACTNPLKNHKNVQITVINGINMSILYENGRFSINWIFQNTENQKCPNNRDTLHKYV